MAFTNGSARPNYYEVIPNYVQVLGISQNKLVFIVWLHAGEHSETPGVHILEPDYLGDKSQPCHSYANVCQQITYTLNDSSMNKTKTTEA